LCDFFFQAEDGIRDLEFRRVLFRSCESAFALGAPRDTVGQNGDACPSGSASGRRAVAEAGRKPAAAVEHTQPGPARAPLADLLEIGRASCRERAVTSGGGGR